MVVMFSTILVSTIVIDKVETLGMLLTQSDYDMESNDAVIQYNR